MTTEMATCDICKKEVDKPSLKKCHGCAKNFCKNCHSQSTNQEYCKECVALSGVVHHN
ncbi:MAG: hypothetical protein K9K37_11775 [Desulfocapsa sp.]|nr:hypothetical protein [Desulfocapsa sp.]